MTTNNNGFSNYATASVYANTFDLEPPTGIFTTSFDFNDIPKLAVESQKLTEFTISYDLESHGLKPEYCLAYYLASDLLDEVNWTEIAIRFSEKFAAYIAE